MVWVGVEPLCRRPGHIRSTQRRLGCRFCRRVLPAPRGHLPAPASEPRGRGIGAQLSMTNGLPGCKGVVPMSCARPDRARTARLAISSAKSSLSARPPPAHATPASSH
eukprot:6276820-Prymnesium_polylepis.1